MLELRNIRRHLRYVFTFSSSFLYLKQFDEILFGHHVKRYTSKSFYVLKLTKVIEISSTHSFFRFINISQFNLFPIITCNNRSGLESVPQNAKVHYNYANLQKDLGNTAKAINHYRIALRLVAIIYISYVYFTVS